MYIYKWPKCLWGVRRAIFGETWGDWMQRVKYEDRVRWFERAK